MKQRIRKKLSGKTEKGVGSSLPLFVVLLGTLLILSNCGSDTDKDVSGDSFDRATLLENWADNRIIPGYQQLVSDLNEMGSALATFTATPNQTNLDDARNAWKEAYLAWQYVEMYEIGKAEEITLRNYMNVYPVNHEDLVETISSGSWDLTSVNRQDEQGFPAIDYLLYGLEATDEDLINRYLETPNENQNTAYLTDLADRMISLSTDVLNDWQNGYRETFIERDGSSATESVNKIVNDYLFYYEKHLRAGKIGIPAGVFSTTPLSDRVEARFSGEFSKELFLAGLDAAVDFFNGDPLSGTTGIGLDDYLAELNTTSDGEELAVLVNEQFVKAQTTAQNLGNDLGFQVENDNTIMLNVYDELQKNVVYLKVDMLQALNIRVDFVDADGD